MRRWFNKASEELSKTLVRIAWHGIIVLAALLAEGLVFYVLQLSQFASARPRIEPVLEGAMLLTVLLLCAVFVSLLTLSGWEEVKTRHDEAHGGVGGWVILVVVLLVAPVSLLLFRERPAETAQPRSAIEQPRNAAALKLPSMVRGESATKPMLHWPPEADALRVSFFVAVQRGYVYLSELDGGLLEQLDFRDDGLFEQLIPRWCLKNGTHRLKIYRHRSDGDIFDEIETFQFETTDRN